MDFELLKVIVPCIAAVVTLFGLYVHWITKFTTTEEEARSRFKQDASRVFFFVNSVVLFVAVVRISFVLWYHFTSSAPITSSDVFEIVLGVSTLLFVLMAFAFRVLMKTISRMIGIHEVQVEMILGQLDVIGEHVTATALLAKEISEIKVKLAQLEDSTRTDSGADSETYTGRNK